MASSKEKRISSKPNSQSREKASLSKKLMNPSLQVVSLDLLDQILDSQFLNSLSDPSRVQILKKLILIGRSDVSKISETLPIDKSVVSRHLSFLSDAGILIRMKVGKQVFYEVDPVNILKRFQDIQDGIRLILDKCCPTPIAREAN
jgi:DNA-binding transcriptional ArsR family regulator